LIGINVVNISPLIKSRKVTGVIQLNAFHSCIRTRKNVSRAS
jgi:hypothetical protein